MFYHSHPDDAPTELWLDGLTVHTVGFTTGLAAEARPELPAHNSGVMSLLLGVVLLVAFSARRPGRYFRTLFNNLWSIRMRANAFDDHTANESRITFALLAQTWVVEALLAVAWMVGHGYAFTPVSLAVATLAATLAAGLFYALQLAAYHLVGYTFTTRTLASQWIRGFNATQALLGFALLPTAIVATFFPQYGEAMLALAAALYLAARLVFIGKGFRIFYHNLFSLVYFILYLCSVEIIPPLIACRGVYSICHNFLS